MIKKDKTAQGHIEFMMSFVIFVGAIFFLFVLLNPLTNNQSTQVIKESSYNIIIKNISADVGKISIIVNKTLGNCYSLPSNYKDNFSEITETPLGSNLEIYTLYFLDSMNNYHPHYSETCVSDYTLGIYTEESLIIEKKIILLKSLYENDYKNLKKSLGISSDFDFTVRYLNSSENGKLSVHKTNLKTREKYVKEIPIRIINESGNINEMIIDIGLW